MVPRAAVRSQVVAGTVEVGSQGSTEHTSADRMPGERAAAAAGPGEADADDDAEEEEQKSGHDAEVEEEVVEHRRSDGTVHTLEVEVEAE